MQHGRLSQSTPNSYLTRPVDKLPRTNALEIQELDLRDTGGYSLWLGASFRGSWDCSGWCILGYYRLGGWNMTRKRLGGCQMDDRHGSRESFKRRAMFMSFSSFPLPPHSPSFAPLRVSLLYSPHLSLFLTSACTWKASHLAYLTSAWALVHDSRQVCPFCIKFEILTLCSKIRTTLYKVFTHLPFDYTVSLDRPVAFLYSPHFDVQTLLCEYLTSTVRRGSSYLTIFNTHLRLL